MDMTPKQMADAIDAQAPPPPDEDEMLQKRIDETRMMEAKAPVSDASRTNQA
jgi:hypothetical protein